MKLIQEAQHFFKLKQGIYLLMIVLFSGFLISTVVKTGHDWGGDFSLYIRQSKALVEEQSLQRLYDVNVIAMNSSKSEIGPYLYPNGFPILLSPVYYFFGIDFIKMKMVCSFLFLLTIPLIYNLFKSHFSNSILPLIIVSLFALNYKFLLFTNKILSDLPFLFFCLLAMNMFKLKVIVRNQVLTGICIFLSYFIRDIGIFLIPSLFVYQITNQYRKGKLIHLAIPYLIFALLFILSKLTFPSGGANHYSILFSNLSFSSFRYSFFHYLRLISESIFHNRSEVLLNVTIVLSLVGMYSSWRKNAYLIVFTACNLLIVVVWPALQGVRFVFPLIPITMFFIVQSLLFFCVKLKLKSKLLYMFLAGYLLFYSYKSYENIVLETRMSTNYAYSNEMVDIYDYISENIDPDETVGFLKPRVLTLFTNAKSIYTDEDHFEESVAKYLLIEKSDDNLEFLSGQQIKQDFSNYMIVVKTH